MLLDKFVLVKVLYLTVFCVCFVLVKNLTFKNTANIIARTIIITDIITFLFKYFLTDILLEPNIKTSLSLILRF